MRNTSNRSNAAQTRENKTAANEQQVNSTTQAQAQGTPVPAKLEDVEARLNEYTSGVKDLKKKSQKANENLAKMRDMMQNERYVVATLRMNLGKATEEDKQIVASFKSNDNAESGLGRAFAAMPKDTDEVANARSLAKSEEGSLTSAINDTQRNWNSCYATLYGTIGLTNKKQLTPALLKELCPYLQVASAEGLKAATVTRTAVRKNGKAVKQDGKRVYKYTLRERSRWSAYGLFETLERNFYWSKFFSADEMGARKALLDNEVAALKALKKAKEDVKSDVPVVALEAEERIGRLEQAAKAAGKASAANTAEQTKHTTKNGKQTKVA